MDHIVKITYVGELDTQKELNEIFHHITSTDLIQIAESIGLQMYCFEVTQDEGNWIVYKTHNQLITFLHKFTNKYKKPITFENIRKDQTLSTIIMQNPGILDEQWFIHFFQVQMGAIGTVREGKKKSLIMRKYGGGRYYKFQCCCLGWKHCQTVILKDGIITLDPSSKKIQEFMHFGKDFRWNTEGAFDQQSLVIHSYHRKMTFKISHKKEFFIFAYILQTTLQAYKKQQRGYRFNSFAPLRSNNEVDFFIDGADYYESLALDIEKAKEQIYICGWWVSPQFHLIRPCEGNIDYRLDNLLARVSNRGVKIYIIVYFQSSFLTNDSQHTIQKLEQLNKNNIKVIRHPQIIFPTFWSHHEKLVCIDQDLVYMGGLDICYGRYDTQSHLIDQNSETYYPGIEYNNCRINDFVNVKNFRQENVERHHPRLPWHDVALKLRGMSVKDLSRHFIQYWNYASYQSHYADRLVLVTKYDEKKKQNKVSNFIGGIRNFAMKIKNKAQNEETEVIDQKQCQKAHQNNKKDEVHKDEKQSSYNLKTPKKQKPNDQSLKQFELNGNKFYIQPRLTLQKQLIQKLLPSTQKRKFSISQESSGEQNLIKMRKMQTHDQINQNQQVQEIQEEKIQNQPKLDLKVLFGLGQKQEEEDMMINKKSIDQKEISIEVNEKEIEKLQEQKIESKQKIIRQSFKNFLNLEKEIDQNDNYIENELNQDYLKEKTIKKKDGIKQMKAKMKFSESSPSSHGEEHQDRKFMFTSWMDRLVKKTKKTFGKSTDTHEEDQFKYYQYNEDCQVVRSASQWSIGCMQNNTEKSICEAYVNFISSAEKYIYIENQFFISATKENGVVKNRIMEAICERIIRAIEQKKKFKVIVFMPLIPGFAGELDDPNATLPRVIMNWQYKTICRTEGSLFHTLQQYTNDPGQYVSFYSLRTHGVIKKIPKTQIIYLHSKLLIVDDRKVICGSANINDRSMEGNRDSQLCLVIESQPQHLIKLDEGKQNFKVVEKIHQLRISLMGEHFGISQKFCIDMLSRTDQKHLFKIAESNTFIYRQLFGCYPDDQITKLAQIKEYKKETPSLQAYNQLREKIVGHAVLFPLRFLEDQKLTSIHPNALST